jgi:hypothetical protein
MYVAGFYRRFTMLPVEEAIVEKLRNDGPCLFDEVVTGIPNFSWGEIFAAVDCMSRDGRVCLRPLGFSTYQLSLGSGLAYSSSMSSPTGQEIKTETL